MKVLLKYPRIFFALLLLALLVIFNSTRRPVDTDEEREFRAAIDSLRTQVRTAEPGTMPFGADVRITVQDTSDPEKLLLRFQAGSLQSDAAAPEKAVRLLGLIEETGVLSSQSGDFKVQVDVGSQQFAGAFNRVQAERSIPLSTFLKLMVLNNEAASSSQATENPFHR